MTFEDCSDDRAGWDSIAKRLQAAVVDLAGQMQAYTLAGAADQLP
jgi:hypothetical protein